MTLTFSIFQCDKCDEYFTLDTAVDRCPICHTPHDNVDQNVTKRVSAFSDDLAKLNEKIKLAELRQFNSRGNRLDRRTYLFEYLRPMLDKCVNWMGTMTSIMESARWNSPQDAQTVESWQQANDLIFQVSDEVISIKRTVPPIVFIAVHRTVADMVLKIGHAALGFFSTITAPSQTSALEIKSSSQRKLDHSALVSGRMTRIIQAFDLWLQDSNSELYNLVHEDSFRAELYPELELLRSLDNSLSKPLESGMIEGVLLHDRDRRIKRNSAARAILECGTSGNIYWTDSIQVITSETIRARNKLAAEQVRLAVAIKLLHADPLNEDAMRSVMQTIMNLLEGPIKKLGAILCVALKVKRDRHGEIDMEAIKNTGGLSDILEALARFSEILTDKVDKVVRNANAHNEAEIVDGTIVIRYTSRNSTRESEERFTIEDLMDQAANVHELAFALISAVVVWLLTAGHAPQMEEFRQAWLNISQ